MKNLCELINNPLAFVYNEKLERWLDEQDEISEKEYDKYNLTGDNCDNFECGEEDNDCGKRT